MSDTELITSRHANPRNPRRMTPLKMQQLRRALEEFGDLGGIILNRRTGHLVGGHQRISAFKEAEVPAKITKRLSKPDRTGTTAYGHIEMFGTRYAYREVDWDESRELAANIAANKHGGEFEWEAVSNILKEVSAAGIDPTLTGFDDDELIAMLRTTDWNPPQVTGTEPSLGAASLKHIAFTPEQMTAAERACAKVRAEHDDPKASAGKCLQIICESYLAS